MSNLIKDNKCNETYVPFTTEGDNAYIVEFDPSKTFKETLLECEEGITVGYIMGITDTSNYPTTVPVVTQSTNTAVMFVVNTGKAIFTVFEYDGDMWYNNYYTGMGGDVFSGWKKITVS